MKPIDPVPAGYHSVTPWLIVRGAAGLIDFLVAAFGATELARVPNPDGSIGHAEVRVGDSVVMLFDSGDGWPETPGFLRLYLPDGEAVMARALTAGAVVVTPMTSLFFGDRVGRIRDPWGNVYWIQTREREPSPAEFAAAAQDPAAVAAMQGVEDSLDREMRSRAVGAEVNRPGGR